MKILNIILLSVIFSWFGYQSAGQSLEDYYPKATGQIVRHAYFALDYNEAHEQANWVIYFAGNFGNTSRNDQFREDPEVKTGSATLEDYKGSGYDRGHLAPAADMNFNTESMSESFYLSNMSPQIPSFNRGIWKSLEELLRDWSAINPSDWDVIVTGPVLTKPCGVIGNHVTVPCSYYKIYADMESLRSIAFILPNEGSETDLKNFTVSIDSLEAATGIDFFHLLSNSAQNKLESTVALEEWNWNPQPKSQERTKEPLPQANTQQCKAFTQSGKRCSRKATPSGYCWQHEKH